MIAYSSVAASNEVPDDSLVTEHLGLVKRIAHHLAARLPASVDIDDLIQSGMIGLLEAAANFDADRGASFETYAGIRIRGAMLDDIRKLDWTPRSVHHKYRQVSEAIQQIENETGCAAEPAAVAERLKLSMDEYHKILADSAGSRLISLDEAQDEPQKQRPLPASATAKPDDAVLDGQFREKLVAAIESLPERDRLVLSLYYERELNLKEIGAGAGGQ